jgi:alkylated DNA repair dioxygenase AlkB
MQKELFQKATTGFRETKVHELGNAAITEYISAFTEKESLELLKSLLDEVPWRHDSIWIAGKNRQIPRLQCWMADPGTNYKYSGLKLTPAAWSKKVLGIKSRVESVTTKPFNSVLLNYYRNGMDSMAWHADDEKELGENPVISSVSFGAERCLQFKSKLASDNSRVKLIQHNGSIFLMGHNVQNNWLHQIAKEKKLIMPRINLTFRYVY